MTSKESKLSRQELITGVVMLLLGLAIALYSSQNLTFGSYSKPGSGFFPTICGYGISLAALIWILPSFIGRKIRSVPLWPKGEYAWKNAVIAMVLLALYAITTDPLGYVLATFAFMALWQIIIVREKWWKMLLIAVISTASVYVIFIKLLRISVPVGPLGF